MHNIKRIEEPESLKGNKEKWTNELLNEISEKGKFSDVDKSFKKHYKQKDVSDSLYKMNGNGYCFYCEQRLGKTDYAHIEHFKPKSKFPELTFEWKNMHLSCTKCNLKKGVQWDYKNPILDPCDDNTDVREHISYSLWELIGESDNALTTIDTFFLNDKTERKELVSSRKKVMIELLRCIESVKAAKDSVQKRKAIENLKRFASGFEFKRMIEYTIDTLLD